MASILFLGASGQVGGAFLSVFRTVHPQTPITAYLRSTILDEALTALGNVTIIHGTFEEYDRIKQLAATHDIIINCAASFNPPLTTVILEGIKNTKATTAPKKPILLHLSGAGNFVDHSKTGEYVPKEHQFNDSNPDDVRKIDASYPPNGATDGLIFAAAAEGKVNALFVCPGGIYGQSTDHIGVSIGAAAAKAAGVWVLWSLNNVKTLGFSPYVGPGTSIFRLVHVDDVVSLMMLVYQRALDTWDAYKPEDVYSHFYLCVDEAPESKKVAEAFGELLYREGKIASPVPKQVPYGEAGITAGYSAGNLIVEAVKAKELGWEPRAPKRFFETLRESHYD
ncbi:hypothetical protein MMC21_006577 [Puttea exsequens]|nr:hypothetical protein [Puttea exsequens]